MRVLVVSDSHGRHQYLEEVMEKVKPDLMLHLGDGEDCEDLIEAMAPCDLEIVRGNCDYGHDLDYSKVIELGRHRIFMTHGHYLSVRLGNAELIKAAKENDCDVAMYGHTHVPEITEEEGVIIYNPGSISLPRQDGREPTYIVLDVDKDGEFHAKLCRIQR